MAIANITNNILTDSGITTSSLVPTSRTLTINGTAFDLTADRSWTIASGVTSFNTRTGAITLSSGDVTGALGFTPYNATNPSGYITSSASITGTSAGVVNTVSGTNSAELVRGNMADNDQFRILVGGTGSNAGYAEIATADDGTEPIYVRQYTGTFTTLTRTLTLLDGSGNTTLPGTLTASNFSGSSSGTNTGDQTLAGLGGLPLTGGTLTGALNGTSATFSSSVTASARSFIKGSAGYLFDVEEQGSNKARLQSYVVSNEVALIAGYDTTAVPMTFYAGGSERMRITSSGSVGIGTSSPSSVLEVAGTSSTSDFRISRTVSPSTYFYIKAPGGSPSASQLGVNGTDVMTLNASGNVGIGTSSPSSTRLDVVAAAGGTALVLRMRSNDDYSFLQFTNNAATQVISEIYSNRTASNTGSLIFATNNGGSSTERMRITSGGNVLIGTQTDNGYKLQINGSASFAFGFLSIYRGSTGANDILFGNDGSRIYIGGNNYVAGSVTATGGFFDTSDSRLKIVINDYDNAKGIEKVEARLYFKNNKKELGYFAQDLQEILPSAVSEGSDGYLTLSYSQVHTAKIAYLEKEIAELKELIKSLL